MQLMFYRHLRWLLHTNDIHGRIEAHTPRGAQSPIGGLVHVVHVAASHALLGQRMKSNMGPTDTNTSWEAAKFEVCAHKWAELGETGYGVSLLKTFMINMEST